MELHYSFVKCSTVTDTYTRCGVNVKKLTLYVAWISVTLYQQIVFMVYLRTYVSEAPCNSGL